MHDQITASLIRDAFSPSEVLGISFSVALVTGGDLAIEDLTNASSSFMRSSDYCGRQHDDDCDRFHADSPPKDAEESTP